MLDSPAGITGRQRRDALTSRSTDGGLTWGNPVTTATGSNDKNWIVCDNTASSPHYGHCYTEYDVTSSGDSIRMRTSTNVGAIWGAALAPGGSHTGLGGQPVVLPNGDVIVPYLFLSDTIRSLSATTPREPMKDLTVASTRRSARGADEVDFEAVGLFFRPGDRVDVDGDGNLTGRDTTKRSDSRAIATDDSNASMPGRYLPPVAPDRLELAERGYRAFAEPVTHLAMPSGVSRVGGCDARLPAIPRAAGPTWSAVSARAVPITFAETHRKVRMTGEFGWCVLLYRYAGSATVCFALSREAGNCG
jgi:hypothetical protein